MADSDAVIDFDKSGFVELRVVASSTMKVTKSWNHYWVILGGSSLFFYKTAMDVEPKFTIEAKGCNVEVEEGDKKKASKKNVLVVKVGDDQYDFSTSSSDDRDSWCNKLKEASSKAPQPAPEKEKIKKKKQSMMFRAKKTMAGKAATSGAGKGLMKRLADEDTMMLLTSMKAVITKDSNKKKADEIENDIVKIAVKSYMLVENKTLPSDAFLAVDGPLRTSFELLSKIFDNQHRVQPNVLDDAFKKVEVNLQKAEKVLCDLLLPHLKPKSINRIRNVFGYLGSARFLKEVFLDEELEDEVHDLVKAMEYYTQFHHYREHEKEKKKDGKK